ncbi:MAG TPA: hypothetical protein PL045_09645 [Chitinophagaceae bacterium]|nr:hypothetical protein [Chitinophagaceae bacterium]
MNEFKPGTRFFFVGDKKNIRAKLEDHVLSCSNGIIYGEKGEYPVSWCRLPKEQPEQLKTNRHECL